MATPSDQLQALSGQTPGFDQSNVRTRRARGTGEKAVANAAVNAVGKVYAALLPLDEEQRQRVLSAVQTLFGDTP
jgi:hypothetical protein